MRLSWLVAICCCVLAQPLMAQGHLVVIVGLGGEPRFSEEFHEWAVRVIDAAEKDGLPAQSIVYLGERVERDPELISARSTRENVERTFHELAERSAPGEQIFILLIGHGSYRNGTTRFNLPGPDMSAERFGQLLDGLRQRRVVFVNAASASGEFIRELSAENRIIITATRSGSEKYETQFGKHFANAFSGAAADLDKDGRVSVLEAFQHARREVERFYENANRLATEHSQLDDNGDGKGSGDPSRESEDGSLAATAFLTPRAGTAAIASETPAPSDPELAALLTEKKRLEEEIAGLRARKDEMEARQYEAKLEELLVQLALNARAIREYREDRP